MQQGNMKGLFLTRMWRVLAVLALATQHVSGKTLKYQIYEEQKVGTVIARLKDDVADVLAKLPSSVSLRFRAMQRGSSSFLTLREQDGEISIRTKIDREKLCEKNLNCSIQFDVLTLPTEHLQLFHVEVEVLDINDNAPQFARAVIPIEISESASVGARIPLDSATDPDVGENSLYTYALEPNNFFKLDIQSRTDGVKYAELVVLRELDREVRSGYELHYTASDRGVPPRTGSTLLKISVADSNDNSPVFEKSSYVINLPENSPVGKLIIDLNATDADDGTNAKIVYSFSSHVSPKIMETFKINPDSGHLTLIRRVDYETVNSYDIDVQAQDMGPNSMPAHCKILVKVVDVNDNKPDISISLMSAQGNGDAAYISEASPLDTFVALVRVEDLDSGLNGEVECKLHGQGYFKLQKTYENNYMILTNVSLDREKRSEFSLTVVAEDRGTPSLSTVKHFTVHVTDENDNPPRFEKGRYEVFKSENNAPGAYLTSILATDPDLDANGQVSYSILENFVHGSSISTYVTIDPSNGAIYALRTFDREDVSRISFVVQAKDAGKPPLLSNATVILNIQDENDNPPVIVVPQLWNFTADVPASKFTEAGHLVTVVRATDRDTGVNAELICSIVSGNEEGYFLIDPRSCEIHANASLENFPHEHVELTVVVRDQGSESLSAKAVLKITLYENMENHGPLMDQGESSLDASLIIIISLGAICAVLLVIMVVFAAHCNREKKDTRHSYNCRVAESTHQHHPKKPSRQIHKGDITLVPTVNGTLPIRAHHRSPSATPPMERAQMGSRQNHHSRQSLNSLVTISSNHIPESFALELAHATPPVEQVSQLLSMLHQGQYQPRPSFRGNKYTRSYRYALNEMDKFSLKDSGRGDSEAGDSDYEPGRESPMDRLLGEGFTEIYAPDGQHRPHAAMRLCTEECRVLGHSDQCWMPPLASPASTSSDYRSNLYIPGEETRQATDLAQETTPQPCTDAGPSRNQSFSTFGKDLGGEDGGEEEGGEDESNKVRDEDLCGTTSLLSEMSSVFQRLLPQGLDSYVQVNENQKGTSLSGVGVPMSGSLDRRRGHLPGKPSPSVHQQGVAAWAANTHFQNPGSNIGPSGHHQGGSYHTLKPSTKLSSQSSSHKVSQAPKICPQNSGHIPKSHNSPLLTALVSPTLVQASTTPVPVPVPVPLPGPSSKWLPAMEEIPENYEEDDFDSVLSHLQGKRSDSRHELVDASELVAEINKLLQDVRQS